MKKLISLWAILICFVYMHCPTHAQTVQASETDYYTNEIGINAIVRTDSINHSGTLIYYEDAIGRSYFLYRKDDAAGTTYKYLWPNHTLLNFHKFTIHDMVIQKSHCFFCGTYTDVPNSTTKGLVGCITLDHIEYTPAILADIDIYLCTIPDTKEFTQMDAHQSTGGFQICLVGQSTSTTSPSCAAFVEWQNPNWSYRVVEVQDPNETMTDIAFSGLGTKIVAVSRYNNEPYKFGLRGEYTSNLFSFGTPISPIISFTHRNTVNTQGLYLASTSNPYPTWHDNNIVARIVCPPNSEEFTVAYECVDATKVCETQRQVALFRIDISTFPWNYNMNLTGKQIVHGYFEESSTFTDMIYIPYNKHFALLHRSGNSSNGKSTAVQFPSWLGYGQINTLISDIDLHSSMSVKLKNNIYWLNLVGNNQSDSKVCYFQQNLDVMKESCYMTHPMSLSEELLETDWSTYQGIRDVNDNNHYDKLGYSTTIYASGTPWDNKCTSYHIQ